MKVKVMDFEDDYPVEKIFNNMHRVALRMSLDAAEKVNEYILNRDGDGIVS